jgi:hypothetical protein
MGELLTDKTLQTLIGLRLPRVFFHAGILPNRNPEAIAALDAAVDAEIEELGLAGSPDPCASRDE